MIIRLLVVALFLFGCTKGVATAQETVAPTSALGALVRGHVATATGAGVSAAHITLTGSGHTTNASTDTQGDFAVHVPQGVYVIVVSKAGFEPAEYDDVAVSAQSAADVTVRLVEATTSTLHEIGRTSVNLGRSPINVSSSPISSLPPGEIGLRPNVNLNELIPELPGVSFQRTNSPNAFWVARGAQRETQVEIDGHPISGETGGSFNTFYLNPFTFGAVDVVEGAGLNGPNAAEAPFGTINLRTRDFTEKNSAQVVTGIDGFGAQYSSFFSSINVGRGNKFSLLTMKNVIGSIGTSEGFTANNALGTQNLINFQGDLSSHLKLSSEIVKARYRFNDQTSLSAEFVGFHGTYNPTGEAYGGYVGPHTIAACYNGSTPANDPTACTPYSTYNAPSAQGLIGQTIDLYSVQPATQVRTNQPFFSAELRTSIAGGTLLLRPYANVTLRDLDYNGRANQPGDAGGWYQVTNPASCVPAGQYAAPNAKAGTGARGPCFQGSSLTSYTTSSNPCSPTTPCYVPTVVFNAAGQPEYGQLFNTIESDRLHGFTVSYTHQLGARAYLNASYDYSSDNATSVAGDPSAFGVPLTVANSPISTPPTLERRNEYNLSVLDQITDRLELGAALYLTNWQATYQIQDPSVLAAVIAANPNYKGNINAITPLSFVRSSRSLTQTNPRFALTYRPNSDVSLRATAGSGITLPFANLISGISSYNPPTGSNNFFGTIAVKNPALRPEVTVAYDLGADVRLRRNLVFSSDLFYDTIHDVWIGQQQPYTGPALPVPPGSTLVQSTTINGPIQRDYGIELSLRDTPREGWGYLATLSLERAYLDQLPGSLYQQQQSTLINGVQQGQVPFSKAYGELRYGMLNGFLFTFGADYLGPNNSTNGPAFATLTRPCDYRSVTAYRCKSPPTTSSTTTRVRSSGPAGPVPGSPPRRTERRRRACRTAMAHSQTRCRRSHRARCACN